jgi:hypothetical protein
MFTFLLLWKPALHENRFIAAAAAFEVKFTETSLRCWCLHHLLAKDIPPRQIYGHFPLSISCCSHSEHRASVKRFVSLQFLNLRQSAGLLGRVIRPSQCCCLHRTTQTQNKLRHIHALSGIRTHCPSVWVGEDSSCPRARGHWDRHILRYL